MGADGILRRTAVSGREVGRDRLRSCFRVLWALPEAHSSRSARDADCGAAPGNGCAFRGRISAFRQESIGPLSGPWIQAGRFAGSQRSRLIDSTESRSYLAQAVADAVGFMHKRLLRESIIEGLRREERWSVPWVAIREAATNAVVHADYSQQGAPIRAAIFDDRIEIENPGMLPFGLTIEDIQQGVSKKRNRVIDRAFQELRLIEQWGSGIQRMIEACLAAGLPVPKFEELGTHFRVTIFSKRVGPPLANETDGKILGLLVDRGPLSTAVIAKEDRSVGAGDADSPAQPTRNRAGLWGRQRAQ